MSNSNFGHHPMTSALATTETIGNSCLAMIPHTALNAFFQGLVDKHGSLLGPGLGNCTGDNGAVDNDKLEEDMARHDRKWEEASHQATKPKMVSSKMRAFLLPLDVSWIRPVVTVTDCEHSIVRDSDFGMKTTTTTKP